MLRSLHLFHSLDLILSFCLDNRSEILLWMIVYWCAAGASTANFAQKFQTPWFWVRSSIAYLCFSRLFHGIFIFHSLSALFQVLEWIAKLSYPLSTLTSSSLRCTSSKLRSFIQNSTSRTLTWHFSYQCYWRWHVSLKRSLKRFQVKDQNPIYSPSAWVYGGDIVSKRWERRVERAWHRRSATTTRSVAVTATVHHFKNRIPVPKGVVAKHFINQVDQFQMPNQQVFDSKRSRMPFHRALSHLTNLNCSYISCPHVC